MPLGSEHLTHSAQELATHRGQAYFGKTGPEGKTCGACKHRGYRRERREPDQNGNPVYYGYTGCFMFKKLSGKHGPEIKKDYYACKYFEAKS